MRYLVVKLLLKLDQFQKLLMDLIKKYIDNILL